MSLKHPWVAIVVGLVIALVVDHRPRLPVAAVAPGTSAAPTAASVSAQMAKMPLRFEANAGQQDEAVRFVARSGPASLFLTDDGATLALRAPRARAERAGHPRAPLADVADKEPDTVLTFGVKGGRAVTPRGEAMLETKSNYFLGSDPTKWRTNVANYGRVVYPDVLRGVDLVYHGEDGQLEYDFVVAPGASPAAITLDVGGAEGLRVTDRGELAIHTARGEVVQPPPRVYQRDDHGAARDVHAGYRVVSEGAVAFEVAAYDTSRPLVIDPVVTYATYLGGASGDYAYGVAVDASGDAYVTGYTSSTDFPKASALQGTNAGSSDAFVTKMKADGTGLVFSTYLGGTSTDIAYGIAVDASGNAYVTGQTDSTNFPTANALQTANAGSADVFVTKVKADGSALLFSTYLGGNDNDYAYGIAVDASGNAYVTGQTDSTNFPTANALQVANAGYNDVFVTKVKADGTGLVFSTYLGGTSYDLANGVAVDVSGNAYITGHTGSTNFPTANALQVANAGGWDAFVTKVKADGSALVFSTYLGGTATELAYGIAVDASGNAYVTGQTNSTNFPTANALQAANAGSADVFVTKVKADGTGLAFSTYLGGVSGDFAYGVAVDASGSAYVTGLTDSTNFPTANALQGANAGGSDAFVTKVKADGTGLVFSTYLGGNSVDYAYGVAVDANGNAYVAGQTSSTNFPTANALQPANAGNDAFIAKISFPTLALAPSAATVAPRGTKTFTASGGSGGGYTYDLQTNASGGSIDASGNYTAGATGSVTDVVRVTDSAGAIATANVTVGPGVSISTATTNVTPGQSINLTASGGSGTGFTWSLPTNHSGATLNPQAGATVAYKAGPTGSTSDTVQVTDSNGNVATIAIAVGAGVSINPVAPTVAPRQSVSFTAAGGSGAGYAWSFVTNASGGTLSAAGAYKAGATPNVTDTVKVTDSLGNTATTNVTVGPALAVSPAAPAPPPRGSVAFAVSGGTGAGITWAITANASGGTIDASGAYKAGATANVTDTVQATDSVGNTATATVHVGAGVSITPPAPASPPKGAVSLVASGGSGTGFAFTFVANASGGALDGATGAYVAGPTGNKTDTVKVTDSLGNTAQVAITVGAGVSITPASPALPPLGTVTLVATGGSGADYQWTITTNASGGAVDGAGHYTAGPTGSTVDTVKVTDSLGNTATVNVSVGGGLAITPSTPATPPKGSIAFSATGGSGAGYAWSFVTNASGGTLSAAGAYEAGATGDVTDAVKVTDSLGNVAQVDVTVGAGVTILPGSAALAPLGTQTFGAAGGSGAGYTWSLVSNLSGGSVDGASGAYKAGATGSVTDAVQVTDSLGNTATANVTVGAALAITPASATVAPKGTKSFVASGGAGGYSFAITTNGSGGNVSSTSGAYVAGATGSTTDVVRITDANGATATASIGVGPGVSITPATPSAPPLGAVAFAAAGGSGAGYTWALTTNASGASIDATTGAYTAGATALVSDVVTVTDSLGNAATVSVSVGGGLAASPVDPTVAPRGAIAFSATGGQGTGYTWTLVTNASGGSLDEATGAYTAGPTPSVTDVVKLMDPLSNVVSIHVHVGPGVSIDPPSATITVGGTQAFAAAGGSGKGFTWSLSTNGSGASIGSDGLYTAGPSAGTDVVSVADSLGNTATSTVTVSAAPAPPSPSLPDAGAPPAAPTDSGGGCTVLGASTRGAATGGLTLAFALAAALRRRRGRG